MKQLFVWVSELSAVHSATFQVLHEDNVLAGVGCRVLAGVFAAQICEAFHILSPTIKRIYAERTASRGL